jgi:lipoate-protein ligase A
MGVDEALARLCVEAPVLRFYAWDRPTLSLGYGQTVAEVDVDRCRAHAVRLVRRPTGGRAVLHGDDLTYSLVLPLIDPWAGLPVTERYRRINACLVRGLASLGLPAILGAAVGAGASARTPFCFAAMGPHEVLVDGKKVIGSAQRRFSRALLQQGAILLTFDPSAALDLIAAPHRGGAIQAFGRIGSLSASLGFRPTRRHVEAAIRDGFAREMGIEFEAAVLGPAEQELAEGLAAARYGSEEWTFRR